MNKALLASMQKQLVPSPQVRSALNERLAQAGTRRPGRWRYGVLAACAALALCLYPTCRVLVSTARLPLHSYVTDGGAVGFASEHATAMGDGDTGGGADPFSGSVSAAQQETGDLPNSSGPDAPTQDEANDAYQRLMDHLAGDLPDWYGGAYLSEDNRMVVLLVGSQDPGDKSLERQVLEWTGDGPVVFGSAKYSLAHLESLMEQLNALWDTDPQCAQVMSHWGTYEMDNRIELTLTQADEHTLAQLARLDPDGDAILVRVGQRASRDLGTEDPISHTVQPGGTTAPDDDAIALEPPGQEEQQQKHYAIEDLLRERPQPRLRLLPQDTSGQVPSCDPLEGQSP